MTWGEVKVSWLMHLGHDVEAEELRHLLTRGSLAEAFHLTAAATPDRPALELDEHRISHGELDALAARLAGWMVDSGLTAGDRVLLCAGSSLPFVGAYLGALWAGSTVVLANPGLTEPELEQLVRSSAPRLVLAAGVPLVILERIAAAQGGGINVTDLGVLVDEDGTPRDALVGAPAPGPVATAGDQIALLAFTSGTTGKPKGAPLTHANLLSSIRAAMLAWHWSGDDVLAHSLPLFHQHGLGGLHATLLAGSRAVIGSRFEPAELAATVSRSRATVLFGVPSMYERLLACDSIGNADLTSLRLVVSGSAPLSPALAARLVTRLGVEPLERYGTTESGLNVSNPLLGDRRPGTVGLPLPGVELAITDSSGARMPSGEIGEIVFRGPQVFAGYRDDPAATAAAFFPGGWFRTGDLGRVDPDDGYVEITGRQKEVILSGGMNVYPREVELALEAAGVVAQAAVVGVPSQRWGEEVVAVVVPRTGANVDARGLLSFARARLAAYKCPKRVLTVPELPLTGIGKLNRAALIAFVQTQQEGAVDDDG
jgi:malonyl-CoA/methylmalonyl-CoA synthetase